MSTPEPSATSSRRAETRTVHFTLDPALRAYLEYLDRTGREFTLEGFDLFRANYRDRVADEDAAQPAASGQGAGEGRGDG